MIKKFIDLFLWLWLWLFYLFIYLFIYFADAGESALIKKLPPGTAYAHFRKRSGATSNVIGKNKILILVKITSY